jgi:hypothetical protein
VLSGGLASVRGVVLDAAGAPVPGARVGGGFSIVTTDGAGRFLLPDVPVGHREIIAISDALQTSGKATIDIPGPGIEVPVTVVLTAIASVAGRVTDVNGAPVPNNKVYLFERLRTPEGEAPKISVIREAVTGADGQYLIERIAVPDRQAQYFVSAFRSDLGDGNVTPVALRFQNQLFRADIQFKGGGRGTVTGKVFDSDGVTTLPAFVSISGERPIVAGGLVGIGFQKVENYTVVETDFTTGAFSFSNVWAGRFVLRAAGQFSPDPVSAEGQMPAGAATVELNLRLQPTGRITGTVLQPDGVTPVGAGVTLTYKSEAFKIVCEENAIGEEVCRPVPQGIQEEPAVTLADGRFSFGLVNAGAYSITAQDPATGRVARVKGEMKPGQNPDISVRLLGIGNVTVHVFGSNTTTEIADADVVLTEAAYPKRELTLRADSRGIAGFIGGNGVNEGEFTVLATDRSNGFAGRKTARVTSDGQNLTVKVYLHDQWGTVSGTVFAPDRTTPVANAEVVLSKDLAPLAFAVTGADGTYEITQVPLGAFTLDSFSAATARRGFAVGSVDVNQQHVPADIFQLGMGVVRGRVMRSGDLDPLVNWEITLDQFSPGGRQLDTLLTSSGLDGEYVFPGVSVGQVRLRASNQEIQGTGSATASLTRDGQALELPLIVVVDRPLLGRLQGVALGFDGSSAAHALIEVRSGLTPFFVTADSEGRFAVNEVPVGRFTITARAQGSGDVGSSVGEILFENHVEVVTVTLAGLAQVTGVVQDSSGNNVANAPVQLDGFPASGCSETCIPGETGCSAEGTRAVICSAFADGTGRFTFANVPARTFSIVAQDPVPDSGLTGFASGVLVPGQTADVRVVLASSRIVTGRAVLASGVPVAGAAAEISLTVPGQEPRVIYVRAGAEGVFTFRSVPVGGYELTVTDPLGTGVARRIGAPGGNASFGDIVLDDSAPSIVAASPVPNAVQVARNAAIKLTFSEPINPGTVTAENITVRSTLGPIAGVLQVSDGDKVVTFTPIALLKDQAIHTVTVKNVEDRLGKVMGASFSYTFQTLDITPPSVFDLTPVPSTNGVTIYTTVRVKYSEPVDPAKYRGPPIRLTYTGTPDGQGTGEQTEVLGRTDFLFGNTVVVFTPARPLAEDRAFTARLEQAFDLSGLAEASPRTLTFSTTDRTPPQLAGLAASNNGKVITNSFVDITADVGTSSDVALVDFFVNGVLTGTDRLSPFVMRLQAVAALGQPGNQIKVEAFGVDTSGNRSTSPVQTSVLIVADSAPGVVIQEPAAGGAFRTGARVDVKVQATDDLGVSRLAYRAATGRPQDAEVKSFEPALLAQTQSFAFTVPQDAVPGSSILIEATALDSKGEQTAAAPISITVLDSVAPTVSIGGVATGERLLPGQKVNAIVTAEDLGSIASITFATTGVVASSGSHTINPPRSPVLASFSFTVPLTARPGDSVRLDATATDKAGNTTSAARIILPIADTVAPTVTLRTLTGRLDIVPGQTVTVIADAEDELAVASVRLTGEGAFTVSEAKQISPPSGSAAVPFTVMAPANATSGSILTLTARATDTSNNTGAAATLALTVKSSVDVTLPASALVVAGQTQQVTLTVPGGAPEGGLRVDLASGDTNIATVPSFVTLQPAESTRTFGVAGVSGGVAGITASIAGVVRATLAATVRGGVVSGVVIGPTKAPMLKAQVLVTSIGNGASITLPAITDDQGRFFVEGAIYPAITARAVDPATGLIGFVSATLNRPNGYANVAIGLVAAGSITGVVRHPDGTTAAGANVAVELWDITKSDAPVSTTATDADGRYRFELAPLGSYRIDASDVNGNRGRALVAVIISGQSVDGPISYLGRGTVVGTVRDAANAAVPNAQLRFTSHSIFGHAPPVVTNAADDGTFRFENVLAGEFSVVATDDATDQAGTGAGEIKTHGQVVPIEVRLSAWGALSGIIYRQDGVTPVSGALVSARGQTTTTDVEGNYTLTLLPLGPYALTVEDTATRGLGAANGTLVTHAATETVNVRLMDQGTLLVSVTTAGGVAGPDAVLSIVARNGGQRDQLNVRTGADGTALVQHVLAGTFEIEARAGTLAGAASGTVAAGVVTPVTVVLEGTAGITGTVFLPDGINPASNGSVVIEGREYAIGSDGRYRIDGLRLREYVADVRDAQGRLRARASLTLTTIGQVRAQNFTWIALGTVNGRVINPDASSASSIVVSVRSTAPEFGGFFSAVTDAAGFYEIPNVPRGPFAVSTGDVNRGVLGEGTGAIAVDDEVVTVDVLLVANAITLPVQLHDANNFAHAVQPGGAVVAAQADEAQLEVIVSGQLVPFAGAPFGTSEQSGREIGTRQQNVAGLNLARKVFVPVDGYFRRHLEIVSNPTMAPVTFDLRLSGAFEQVSGPVAVVRTSSGGDVFKAGSDRWVVVDDSLDGDPFTTGTHAAHALVLDGDGGSLHAAAVTADGSEPSYLRYQWSSIVLPPGATIALLHFQSLQVSRDAAAAAAARLVQLPPEALAGLSADELTWIANFVVPANGTSALSSLPPLRGVISGTALAWDKTTVLPGVPVSFTSSLPMFGRRWTASTDADGRFTFTGVIADGASLPVPLAPFTLRSVYPGSGLPAPDVLATFANNATTTDVSVVFAPEATPPVFSTVDPAVGQQGTSLRVAVSGQFMNFAAGQTTADFGSGVTTTAVEVTSPNAATFDIVIAPTAPTGPRTVTLTTGATTAQYWAFSVQPGTSALTTVAPAAARQGRSLTVTITGSETHFSQGTSIASFGEGISVDQLSVASATIAYATVTIWQAATVGPRTVTMTTGGEVASLASGFAVQATRPAMFVQHLGSADPVSEGFVQSVYVASGEPIAADGDYAAWQMAVPGCCGVYQQHVDTTSGFQHGWRLSARARIVSGSGGFSVALNPTLSNRFAVDVTPSGADAVVTLEGSDLSYTVAGGANQWLLLELLYNPLIAEASLKINGVQRLSGYTGWGGTQFNGVVFGAPRGDAVVNFNLVKFELATDVIDFEDQPAAIPFQTPFPASYRDVTWQGWRHYAPIASPYQPEGLHAIYAAADGASFTFAERVFVGADFSRSPTAVGDIYFELYRRGALVHTSEVLTDNAPELTFLRSGHSGTVDEVRVRSLGASMTAQGAAWAVDNFTFGAPKTRFRPQISWNQPADILYGTALTSDHLSAVASVPGTFVYDPAAGTVLQAGPAQKLSAVFTPADADDYQAATASVTITVRKAPQAPLAVAGAPETAALGATFTVTAAGGSGTGAITFSATDACGSSGAGVITMTKGTGICSIIATRAADMNYEPVSSSPVVVLASGSIPPKLNVLEETTFLGVAPNNDGIVGLATARLEAAGISIAAPAGGVAMTVISSAPECVNAASTTLRQSAHVASVAMNYGGTATLPCEATVTVSTVSFGSDSVLVKVHRYAELPVVNSSTAVSFYNPAPVAAPGGAKAAGVAAVSYYNPAPINAPGGTLGLGVNALSYYNPAPLLPPGGASISGVAAASYYNPAPLPGDGLNAVSSLSDSTSAAAPVPPASTSSSTSSSNGTASAESVGASAVAISVANGPTAMSLSPAELSRGSAAPVTLIIRGASLNGADRVAFVGLDQDVVFGMPLVSGDGRMLSVEVLVLPSAPVGAADVVVSGPGWRTAAVPMMRVEIVK